MPSYVYVNGKIEFYEETLSEFGFYSGYLMKRENEDYTLTW